MEIINLVPEKYKEWDEFCRQSDDAWFWHTSDGLEYMLNYRPALEPNSLSFMVRENSRIVAVIPLIVEKYDGLAEFSFGGDYNFIPALANDLPPKQKEKVLKFIFEKIDTLAKENGICRSKFRFPILNKSFIETGNQKSNFLPKFDYLDASLSTQVIDLNKPITELRREVRHGHDSDIDKAGRVFKSETFNKTNINPDNFGEYVKMHRKAAGRITRPKATFDIMYKTIKEGESFLVAAKRDGVFVGFAYFLGYKNNVYYGSGCNDPELENLPVSHFVQWSAIEWMNLMKYRFYEIGWHRYSINLFDQPTAKEAHISRFVRGFGGVTVPLFRGEKYYDKDYFSKVFAKRLADYWELIS
ncbi:MAG: hypothetical protein COV91_00830 [Candidatus Taylorbacteria bacterium CG11_big_fil_rev_8_21_14_0_20_46_11]|uniref:BioF2-like acetyltransferase domain-containing protein n=1 Tax=Candidatus Taylorbacteria bacterium CG11_big_fil_rev_8_21_14_0_20_46_11 TaxID=1975025 RepID=A0A2H0KCM8_9BACT|nr:MAG: hypothetical protein COV91_00830 [Candidatus Taylorbacteria bacterium CG11_big_fil_rev_8_21_14_0_20_46_11]